MGLAPSLLVYFLAWTILGTAMASGLYDAAFSTLGRLFGDNSRTAMTGVTLMGGFASTVAWPATTGLEAELGWRDTCLALAGVHLAVGLPLYLLLIPREQQRNSEVEPTKQAEQPAEVIKEARYLFVLVAILFTLQSSVMSSLSVHLLDALGQLGFAAPVALAVGMMIGPSQVVARLLEFSPLAIASSDMVRAWCRVALLSRPRPPGCGGPCSGVCCNGSIWRRQWPSYHRARHASTSPFRASRIWHPYGPTGAPHAFCPSHCSSDDGDAAQRTAADDPVDHTHHLGVSRGSGDVALAHRSS